MPSVSSSNIANVEYRAEDKESGEESVLTIQFVNGIVGAHTGVPREKYDGILSASSPGRYYNSEIKGKYPYTRLS